MTIDLSAYQRIVMLTGAGVSAASGLATYWGGTGHPDYDVAHAMWTGNTADRNYICSSLSGCETTSLYNGSDNVKCKPLNWTNH